MQQMHFQKKKKQEFLDEKNNTYIELYMNYPMQIFTWVTNTLEELKDAIFVLPLVPQAVIRHVFLNTLVWKIHLTLWRW